MPGGKGPYVGNNCEIRTRASVIVSILALLAATLAGIVNAAPALAITNVDCDGPGYTPGDLQTAVTAETPGGTVNVTGICTEVIVISGDLNLIGSGPATTTLDGGGIDSVVDVTGGSVSISGVTITNGGGSQPGLDIFPAGIVNFSNSVVTASNGTGVTVETFGAGPTELHASNVQITNNSAALDGGGIWTDSTVSITDSAISGNTANNNGGGIYNFGGTVNITDSTITGNDALGVDFRDGGAGAWNTAGGTLEITGSTFSGNMATGPRKFGGAISNYGTLTVVSSTISGNDAWVAGAVHNHGASATASFTNSTISGNGSAGNVDSGAFLNENSATLSLLHATVVNNTTGGAGGGLFEAGGLPTTTLEGTILAGNSALDGPDCFQGPPVSNGYNLVGDNSDCGGFTGGATDQVGTGASPIDPLLGPLTDNGSPHTHALLPASPAIDQIPPGSCSVATDQRGVLRPQGPNCDIGAFEVERIGHDVGLVDTSQGIWHLRNSVGAITTFGYGNPGDLPISGDWDGNGTSTPGLYRQSDGFFYSRDSNSTGIADDECFAGDPQDVPISGDWDGDGDDNLGIYRPSEQMFYLFTISCTGSPMGAAQISFLFGNPGDNPVAGDWDGDGIDEVGLHRESTGFFYWRNTHTTGIASGEIFFGDPNDRFVGGDWGLVDGVDTPAIFRPSDLTFYFRHTLTQGVADSQFTWAGASSGWLPVAGTFGLG